MTELSSSCSSSPTATSGRTRLLLVVATRIYREGLDAMLRRHSSIQIVGSLSKADRSLVLFDELQPDVVLIDIDMPRAFETIEAITRKDGSCKIVALSVPDRSDSVLKCAEAGIAGFVSLDGSIHELICAIESAQAGEFPCSPKLAARLVRRLARATISRDRIFNRNCLTERELQVISLVERGLSNKAIASKLCIGLPTVKNHVHHILEKLDVRGRTEAAAVWRDVVSH